MPGTLFAKRIHQALGLLAEDHEALRSLTVLERTLEHREPLHRAGDLVTRCTVVRSGFLASHKMASDREQMLGLHVPGDFPDLQSLYVPVLDHDVVSIGPSQIGLIAHSDLKRVLAASPNLVSVFWREAIIEATILREWICNVAARDAFASLSHLICEIASRLNAVGLVTDNTFHLPLTQQDLANATGLSTVHVNRTLQELRRRHLIDWKNRTMTLLDATELRRVGQFDPEYLRGRS